MTKKLWLLNLVLIAALGLVAHELRKDWRQARERERNMLARQVPPVATPPAVPAPAPPPVQAIGYAEVAQQTLFSKDRNSNVIVDPPPPPAPPPPFPKFYGVMNLGDGLEAILSEAPGRSQRSFKVGDPIGEFKLAAIGNDELEFAWKDKTFVKKFSDLRERSDEQRQQAEPAVRTVVTPPAAQVKPAAPAAPGPGTDIGAGVSSCNPGDASPAGTVIDGRRKVVNATPFGQVCRWEPVR